MPARTDALRERFAAASRELSLLGDIPLRLRDVQSRYDRLNELELEFTFPEDQIKSFDRQTASDFLSYLGLWHAERSRLNHSRTNPRVLEDAWQEAREEFARVFPGEIADESMVFAVLAGEPDWDVSEVILISTTLKPYIGPFSRLHYRHALLEIPVWFYRLLRHRITLAPPIHGGFPLSDPLTAQDGDVHDFVVALWDDSPFAEFHDLEALHAAAIALR